MDTVYKILENCEVKKVGERQYEFIASTADQDRDGEVIDVAGWDLKNFKKNPVIMFAHNYSTLPIGRATKIGTRDGKLVNNVEFPPEGTYEFADIVERLVGAGFLKTESVGFLPKKWEDGDGEKAPRRTYTKQELLEISIVPVPSNPNALMNAVKEGVITTKQLKQITELDDYEEPEIVEDKITKPEETDEFIRIPVRTCEVTATIDISKKEGISALYCGKEKQVRTYLFRKDKGWTMAKAKAWVKEHEGKTAHKISQEQIIDEIDYLTTLIKENGMNEDVKESVLEFSQKAIVQLQHELPKENAEIIFHVGKNALGYTAVEVSRMVKGEPVVVGLDLRISGGDIPVKDNTEESLKLLDEIIKEQLEVK